MKYQTNRRYRRSCDIIQLYVEKQMAPETFTNHSHYRPGKRSKIKEMLMSLTISILIMIFAGLLLHAFKLLVFQPRFEPIEVSYITEETVEKVIKKEKLPRVNIASKPTPPHASSNYAVITVPIRSEISIPVPQTELSDFDWDTTFDSNGSFGSGNDFGSGFNFGSGNGFGSGHDIDLGKEIQFMGQTFSAKRVVFAIDISGSMAGPRLDRVKRELVQTINNLDKDTQIYFIFFSSLVYHFTFSENDRLGEPLLETINTDTELYWHESTENFKKYMLNSIEELNVSGGNNWEISLNYAFKLGPAPELIICLTDEGAPKLQKVVDLAKKSKTKVTTMGFLISKNNTKNLEYLAKKTGGEFYHIEK